MDKQRSLAQFLADDIGKQVNALVEKIAQLEFDLASAADEIARLRGELERAQDLVGETQTDNIWSTTHNRG
jgi:hypothetical protein